MLKILLITDNKVGHINISNGIIKYLKQKIKVKITRIDVSFRLKFLIKLATFIINKCSQFY